MKTFDDAVDVIIKELDKPEVWHRNHCRCTEINESRNLGHYCSLILEENSKWIPESKLFLLSNHQLIEITKMMLELGIAIGQEMEKE